MSVLSNLLILTGFGVVALLLIWVLTSRDYEEPSGTGKVFVIFFILLAVLAFIIWLTVR